MREVAPGDVTFSFFDTRRASMAKKLKSGYARLSKNA
jgi:hypothetical protein